MTNKQIPISQVICTQLSSVIGVFLITYPYTFSQLGYVLSIACTIFMCIISGFTLFFLTKCSKTTHINNFDDLIASVSSVWFSLFCSLIFYFGCLFPLVFYLNVSVNFFDSVIQDFELEIPRLPTLLVCNLIVITICITFKNIENQGPIIIFSLMPLILFICYVICTFVTHYSQLTFNLPAWHTGHKSLNSISFIIFAFLSHTNIINIMDCLPNLESAKCAIISSNLISALIYIFVGFVGYCVYPNSTYTYLDNTKDTTSKLILKILLATVNILSFPLMMIPIKKNLNSIMRFFDIASFRYIEIVCIVFNCCLCTFIVYVMRSMDFLKSTFFIIGAFTMFILPMYLYYKICGIQSVLYKCVFGMCIILAGFSLYMGVSGLIGLV